jgi:hypothetical protein
VSGSDHWRSIEYFLRASLRSSAVLRANHRGRVSMLGLRRMLVVPTKCEAKSTATLQAHSWPGGDGTANTGKQSVWPRARPPMSINTAFARCSSTCVRIAGQHSSRPGPACGPNWAHTMAHETSGVAPCCRTSRGVAILRPRSAGQIRHLGNVGWNDACDRDLSGAPTELQDTFPAQTNIWIQKQKIREAPCAVATC